VKPVRPAVPPAAPRAIVISNRHPRLRFDHRALAQAIQTLDRAQARIRVPQPGFLGGELSIALLTDTALAQLHDQFLQDPTVTDVITFEGDRAFGTAGEICVSADAAARHVAASTAGGAFSAELMLYVVHGWLHLAGYDDLIPAKKRAMRRAEARAMAVLREADRLPEFSLHPPRRRPGGTGKRRAMRPVST
jgi:probable rRNA maturation factor